MNNTIKQFLVSMAAFALVFSIYDHFKRPDTQNVTPTVTQPTKPDAETEDDVTDKEDKNSTSSAEDDGASSDSEDKKPSRLEELRALDAMQKNQQNMVSTYKNAALLALGLQVAGTPKIMLTEFFYENNKLPSTNSELGLEAPESFAYQALKSLNIEGEGIIVLTYNETTGVENGTIRLRPDVSNMQAGVRWYCETSSYPEISKAIPTCTYQP